jgi:hypothetical protein
MGIGEKMFGVFQGVPCGENITWQSFGETSWRMTNLAANHFDTQVGYWTNRLVFKGIRFPLHTIDPFIESTISMDSTSNPGANNLQLYAGLEWRPLARNAWLYNFRPFGDIPILEWMRNYRFYIKYGDQKNIKAEIENAKDYDLIWGVSIFYEWGTELPPLDETSPSSSRIISVSMFGASTTGIILFPRPVSAPRKVSMPSSQTLPSSWASSFPVSRSLIITSMTRSF